MAQILVSNGRRTNFGPSITRYFPMADCGGLGATGVEGPSQRTVRTAGTYSNLYVRVFSNTLSGSSSLTFRKNTANGNQTLSIGAGNTGEFEDASNTDAVVATDLINVVLVIGTGTAIRTSMTRCLFAATTNTSITHGCDLLTTTATSAQVFGKYVGPALTAVGTETASQQFKMKVGGTIKNLNVVVGVNGRSSSTTCGSRLNGADGALTLSVGAGTTGQFEDTTHTDTVVSGDLVNRYITAGTGAGTFTCAMYNDFETTDGTTQYVAGPNGQTLAASATNYHCVSGDSSAGVTTESDYQQPAGVICTASQFEAYVSANTIVGASTTTFRKNAGVGSGTFSIPGLTTGWFEDTSNSDSLVATDEIDWQLVGGAAGTSLTLQYLGMKIATPVAGGFFARYYYDMGQAAA